jgi:membrane protein
MAGTGGFQRLMGRVTGLRPVRAFQAYAARRGPILASGLAYQALFSVFAAVWVLFSITGLVLAGDDRLRGGLIDALAGAVPGLLSTGGSEGAIDPDELLQSPTFSWTGIVALVGTLLTALGFLASARDAIRGMFDLPQAGGNGVLLKLRDLAFLVGFAVVTVIATAVAVVGTGATGALLTLVGVPADSDVGYVVGRAVALAVAVVIDAVVVAVLVTVHAGVRVSFARLRTGALLGGTGAAVLTVLFQLGVLGGASANPLLGSFVVILGLLVYFNLLCQVLLIASAYVATEVADTEAGTGRTPRHTRPTIERPRVRRR